MSKKEAFSELLVRKPVSPGKQEHGDTGIQEQPAVLAKKKKATFELDSRLHLRLKVFAAKQEVDMVDIASRAIDQYLRERDA